MPKHMQVGDVAGGMLSGTYPNPLTGTVGTATLSGGTVTVSNSAVTTSSMIVVTSNFVSNLSTGVLSVTNVVAGVSFKVTSNSALDVQPFTYLIIG